MERTERRRRGTGGQGLVELALTLVPFLFLLMGIIDLGRGVAVANGVANAAREIARTTSVHPGSPLGSSPETARTIEVQRGIVLNLSDPAAKISITCTNLAGTEVPRASCRPGYMVRVEVQAPFSVLTPVLSMVAPTTIQSTSHVQIP